MAHRPCPGQRREVDGVYKWLTRARTGPLALRSRRRGVCPGILLTSLRDPVAYPAAELVALHDELALRIVPERRTHRRYPAQ